MSTDAANTDASGGARIPAQALYWGRLPAGSARTTRETQDYRFERVLPLPVERLHTARATLPDGGMLVVGIETERFRAHLAGRTDVTPATWELIPDRLPDHLAATVDQSIAAATLGSLNLLHGAFEPQPRRTLRLRIAYILNAALVLVALLAVIGIERRAARLAGQTQAVSSQTRALVATVVPPQAGDRHPELRLTMELRRLEQAISGSGGDALDPILTLTALWRSWPTDLRAQIEAVGALQDRLVIRGNVPSLADAERVAQACRTLEGPLRLRAQPMQAQASERGASFLLTLARPDAAGGGSRP